MMKIMPKKRNRKGASVVEAALMLPLLVIVTFGAIDIAQYINTGQLIINTSREGARVVSRNNIETVQEVEDAVVAYLNNTIPQLSAEEMANAVTIEVREVRQTTETDENGEETTTRSYSPIQNGDLTTVDSGNSISVLVQFDYSAIRWLTGPGFNQLQTETICRRE